MDWKLSLAGLLIGVLVGMTGMGGGSLMTPMLVFLFGFKPTVAIGTDILHGAVFKTFGAARHRQLGTVHARLTGWMLLGSAPCSLAGVGLSAWLGRRYGEGFEELGRRRPETRAIRELTGWEPTHTIDDAINDVILHEQVRPAHDEDPAVAP